MMNVKMRWVNCGLDLGSSSGISGSKTGNALIAVAL